jgi:hypothetical protein
MVIAQRPWPCWLRQSLLSDLGSNSGGKPSAAHGASSAAGHRSQPNDVLADNATARSQPAGNACVIVEILHCQARVPWPQPSRLDLSWVHPKAKCQTIKYFAPYTDAIACHSNSLFPRATILTTLPAQAIRRIAVLSSDGSPTFFAFLARSFQLRVFRNAPG